MGQSGDQYAGILPAIQCALPYIYQTHQNPPVVGGALALRLGGIRSRAWRIVRREIGGNVTEVGPCSCDNVAGLHRSAQNRLSTQSWI
jgi:hypothetical protein